MKPRPEMWLNVTTGDIAWRRVIFQKLSTAQNSCAEYEIQTQIFTWPGSFWNQTYVDDVDVYFINIQYNMIKIDSRG